MKYYNENNNSDNEYDDSANYTYNNNNQFEDNNTHNVDNNYNEKPKYFYIFKIIGFVFVGIAIIGIILSINSFSNFENNNFMLGSIMATFGFFISFSSFMFGFSPELSKISAKTNKYIQHYTKDDLSDIAKTNAEIVKDPIVTITKAIKEGIYDTKYCKHCGEKISSDSVYCSKCGKKQN